MLCEGGDVNYIKNHYKKPTVRYRLSLTSILLTIHNLAKFYVSEVVEITVKLAYENLHLQTQPDMVLIGNPQSS